MRCAQPERVPGDRTAERRRGKAGAAGARLTLGGAAAQRAPRERGVRCAQPERVPGDRTAGRAAGAARAPGGSAAKRRRGMAGKAGARA
ncbi:hypothetical protein [Streptomyces millisiae]|uniref:Uncharacterized protein n=1 Tax=Streptomyces millisiae TaxID=3075542 RepID=A0ABU2LW35_9ACTN|nr:hypothetical protein [Streptomyces sp. DSM 44918]MDT0321806.1 hypothetical protein [Streptomyces sp. DSM 44918]